MLLCLRCSGSLASQKNPEEDAIADGELVCTECRKVYPIEGGTLLLATKREVAETYPQMEEQAKKGARLHHCFLARFLEILEIGPDAARAAYMEQLELIPSARVLDVGVGTGWDFAYLLSKTRDAQLFGLDISIDMLHQCRRKLDKLGVQPELFLGFAEHLPFQADTFDVVFHTGSINEFKDQRLALGEMTRVAKPGTRIVVADEWMTAENSGQTIGRRLLKAFPSLPRNVTPPTDCVPSGMRDIRIDTIWGGYGYCLQFRKPN